jgi:hypothetical protein
MMLDLKAPNCVFQKVDATNLPGTEIKKMGKLLCRSSLILCVLSLWAAVNTQAQSVSELRCRGGEEALVKLFVIDRRQIHFVVTGAQARSIPAYLKNRNNYWSFFVVNTDRRYFEAKNHKAWKRSTEDVSELRCRGGENALVSLFVIDKLDADTLSLNFNSSKKPAGADSSGLEPGTCSWIDRTVKDEEWRQIHFVVTLAQAQSIPAHLNNLDNYWTFFVVKTDGGYFEAKSHKAWTAAAKETSPANTDVAPKPEQGRDSKPDSNDATKSTAQIVKNPSDAKSAIHAAKFR